MANEDIRKAISEAKVKYWQVADALGMTDGGFSRKLRNELSTKEKERVFRAIKEAAAEEIEPETDNELVKRIRGLLIYAGADAVVWDEDMEQLGIKFADGSFVTQSMSHRTPLQCIQDIGRAIERSGITFYERSYNQ